MIITDEMRLHSLLDQHPDDRAARLVLADLLEETGHDMEAYCQRWLASGKGRWPDNDLSFCNAIGWHWWSNVDYPHRKRTHALLPPEVQHHMPHGEWIYSTRREAEAALAHALQQAMHQPS